MQPDAQQALIYTVARLSALDQEIEVLRAEQTLLKSQLAALVSPQAPQSAPPPKQAPLSTEEPGAASMDRITERVQKQVEEVAALAERLDPNKE